MLGTVIPSSPLHLLGVTIQVGLLHLCTLTFKPCSTTKIMLIKADKQATHKHHLTANVYNDPDHDEPFDIALPEHADIYIRFWWCFFSFLWNSHWSIKYHSTRIFFSDYSLFPALILLFNTPQTVELFISSLVLMKKSWCSKCCNYQLSLSRMWPIIRFSKLWSGTANQHSCKTLYAVP